MSFTDLFAEQGIWPIQPGLFILNSIRDPDAIEAQGINVMVDLEGWFDDRRLGRFLKRYVWWPIKDIPELPNLWELDEHAKEAHKWWQAGYFVGIH